MKILIIYATAGIGHKKAALAIKSAYDELAIKGLDVLIIDSLDYTNPFFRWSYLEYYLMMVNKFPRFWGFLYYLTNNYYFDLFVAVVRRVNNWINAKKLVQFIKKEDPDVIISTHFFATEVVSDMKKRKALRARLVTVITDYRLHRWWLANSTDRYVVASRETESDLLTSGVDKEKISIMGIPIEPVFASRPGKEITREKLLMKKDLLTILIIGGGFGVGPIESIVRIVCGLSRPIQVAVICGHNKELARKISIYKAESRKEINVYGYVNNVNEFMEASDILISKAGGITISESMAKDLPMILIAPIPGQEGRNGDFMVANGAAVKIEKIEMLKDALLGLVDNRSALEAMRKSIAHVKAPEAAINIAKLCYGIAANGSVK